MKWSLVALLLGLSPAFAAGGVETLTITLTTPAGGTLTVTKTLPDADLQKLQDAYSAGIVADGRAAPTVPQIFTEMTNRWVQQTIEYVRSYNQSVAAAAVARIAVQ